MKKSIISDIYYGRNACSNTMRMTEDLQKYSDLICELYDKLTVMLNDNQKKVLEDFLDCHDKELSLESKQRFKEGFKLGLLIGIECMDDYPAEGD